MYRFSIQLRNPWVRCLIHTILIRSNTDQTNEHISTLVLTLLLIPTFIPHPPEKCVNLLKSMQNLMKCNRHIY